MRKLIITPRAQRQIDAAENWWIRNRDKNPDAFEDDLARAAEKLTTNPAMGGPVRARRRGIRRLLLPRTQYYLYYRVEEEIIRVLSLWHASRGSEPRL